MSGLTVVAMSGGVDSSVAALLLHQKGAAAIGVSMQVWDYRNNGGCSTRATCCAPDDFTDARKVAAKIGIPYYVFDFEKKFREEVIDVFVNTYREGKTPNPCVDCNNKVKFRELRNRAKALGCSSVATGHYAKITKDESGYHLLRSNDLEKDQSYFLYGLKQEELKETLFPVGHLTKDEVRALAREAGLPTADKKESQDICFVSTTAKDFVERIGGRGKAGQIVSKSGEVLGSHDGIHAYTIGQRKGLGLGASRQGSEQSPYYVLDIRPENNEVVVGEKRELAREGFTVTDLSWTGKSSPKEGFNCIVQVRHRHEGTPVYVRLEDNSAKVEFISDWTTISPGQAAVFYDQDNKEVLGGGRISL